MTTRHLLGSILLAAAGCATDPTVEPIPPEVDEDLAPAERECDGIELDEPIVAGELSIDDATGLALVTVHNRSTVAQTVDIIVHTQNASGLLQEIAGPIVVEAASSGGVRVATGDIDGDGQPFTVELVVRGSYAQIVQRAFVHAHAGAPIADTAARLGLPLTTTIDGEAVQLASFVAGGRGIDPITLAPAQDATDDLVSPTTPPDSFSYNMCFRWPVALSDAGFGEDYGVDPTSPWIARGGRVKILQHRETLFDGWLDASGCTGAFSAIATADFTIFGYSRARVAGNELAVRDATGSLKAFVIWDADPGPNQTPTFVFPAVEAVSTMLAVSAYTLAKLHGDVTNQTIAVENRCKPGGCCNCSSGGSLWITSPTRKFLIAHEMGHRILGLAIGGFNNDVSFDLVPGPIAGAVCDTTSTHSMWSIENESGAAMEGWAHFVAAAAFNSTAGANPGARMRYWSSGGDTTIDVEEGATGGASQYFNTVCPSVASASRMSVELDWLRHWWDYATNATDVDPGSRPSFTQMMSELDAAPAWSGGTAWSSMRAGIQTRSGAEQLARWDQSSEWNGIE